MNFLFFFFYFFKSSNLQNFSDCIKIPAIFQFFNTKKSKKNVNYFLNHFMVIEYIQKVKITGHFFSYIKHILIKRTMTYIASQPLFLLNQELLSLTCTTHKIHSKIECFNIQKDISSFSTRRTSFFEQFSGSNPMSYDSNAELVATQQHFAALTSAFSCAFPDFDFSGICPWNFKLVSNTEQAQSNINWAFQTEIPECEGFLSKLWSSLEKEIAPSNCFIYAYESDRPDAFSESGATFNLSYFFLNEKMNKVLLVHLREGAKEFSSGSDDDFNDDDYNYGYNVF